MKVELIFIIKWNITLLWLILAFKPDCMLICQWTVIELTWILDDSKYLKMDFAKLLREKLIELLI